ncbi:phage tail protein [Stenotrophomonas muris]|uniref:phage tail protein n=1 Tax=Stenotrophomonas muris TaxID=2963283 RepID=UPI002E793B99|nr:phage tail protein [Stenotrophomonas muris]
MKETFDWPVRVGVQGSGRFAVLSASFGDGYSQTAADGLNNERQQWPVSFVGYGADIAPILAFLRARKGAESFLWTPPLGQQGLYTCKEYNVTAHGNDAHTLSATFEQTFQP